MCSLFFERFVLFFCLKIERFVPDSAEIWICGLYVTDTGTGIPKEKQKKIFNRFEKLNENAQGTGLGLSICQLIIEQLGGSIWIDPDYEEGSRFLFTHPIDKSDQGKEETR